MQDEATTHAAALQGMVDEKRALCEKLVEAERRIHERQLQHDAQCQEHENRHEEREQAHGVQIRADATTKAQLEAQVCV